MDSIRIEDLEVYGNHGVFPEENRLGQKFLITAVLYHDTRKAGKKDDLACSIHYGEVCLMIEAFMKNHTFKLIETVAERLAEHLLLTVKHLQQVDLVVKKPWAPIGLPLDTVAVTISRGWHRVYLGIGSNMGDKEAFLNFGIRSLEERPDILVTKKSSFIITKPYGYLEQDDFLNGCLELSTLLTPRELLKLLQEIEKKADRKREIHWGPRTLDMDILLYDGELIDLEDLTIPHPQMHLRAFVLEPLAEIAPYIRHPLLGKRIDELLDRLPKETEGR